MSGQGHRRYRIATPAVPPAPSPVRWSSRRAFGTIVLAACWMYATALLGLWGVVCWSPPEFWPSHLLLYGPRWVLSLPAPLLIPLAAWLRSRWSALALTVAVTSFLGFWGYNVPWRALRPVGGPSRPSLRLLTCNVQGRDLRPRDLGDLVRSARPDLVLVQEREMNELRAVVGREGWYIRSEGEFGLASRYPILDFEAVRRPDATARIVAIRATVLWSGRTIPVVVVHLMTPRAGLEAVLDSPLRGRGRFREVADVQRYESALLRRRAEDCPGSILLAGDFNLTVEHPTYRRDWSDYANAFSWTGWGLGSTMSTRRIGLRIDHILCGPDWRPTRCSVGPDVGSAHRPVVADLSWRGPD